MTTPEYVSIENGELQTHNNVRERSARNVATRAVQAVVGLAFLSEAALLGIATVDEFQTNNNDAPAKLYFQQELRDIQDRDNAKWTKFEVANGEGHNILATAGLALAGAVVLRRAARPNRDRE